MSNCRLTVTAVAGGVDVDSAVRLTDDARAPSAPKACDGRLAACIIGYISTNGVTEVIQNRLRLKQGCELPE